MASKVGKFEWAGHYAMLPKKEDWRIEEALVALGDHQTEVVVLSDHIFINGTTFEFYAMSRHLPLAITPCCQAVWERKGLSSYDVTVAKSDADWIPRGAQGTIVSEALSLTLPYCNSWKIRTRILKFSSDIPCLTVQRC